MNAIRQVLKVENHRVTVELPADFAAEAVEVIILPAETTQVTQEDEKRKSRPGKLNPRNGRGQDDEPPLTKLQQLLLEAPPMSDEEYELIMEKRRALNEWK